LGCVCVALYVLCDTVAAVVLFLFSCVHSAPSCFPLFYFTSTFFSALADRLFSLLCVYEVPVGTGVVVVAVVERQCGKEGEQERRLFFFCHTKSHSFTEGEKERGRNASVRACVFVCVLVVRIARTRAEAATRSSFYGCIPSCAPPPR
jgi:hypothetical protein